MAKMMRSGRRRGVGEVILGIGLTLTLVLTAWPAGAAAEASQGPTVSELDHRAIERPGRLAETFDAAASHRMGTLVVELKPGVAADDVFSEPHTLIVGSWWEVAIEVGDDPRATAEALARRPGVATVDLDYRLASIEPATESVVDGADLAATDPNDEYYWAQWNFPMVQLPDAWDVATGAGTVVAVIDSGIITTTLSSDLRCHSYVAEYDSHDDVAGAGSAPDEHGHGTHVAGTVAQCTNNNEGMAGVAHGADLMPIKTVDGSGSIGTAALSRALRWAADHGADVANMSLSWGPECAAPCSFPVVADAITYAASADVVMVAATGNQASTDLGSHFPSNHPDVIAVGAVDLHRDRAWYSNYGAGIDLVAPGGDLSVDDNADGVGDGIYQETITSACPPPATSPTDYCGMNGTSMASPHVAAAAAILRSHRPQATRNQVRTALLSSTADLGASGYDNQYGHGLLQIDDALDVLANLPSDTTSPTWPGGAGLSIVGRGNGSVSLDWPDAADDVGVTGYEVLVDGAGRGTVSGSGTTISGLGADGKYVVGVRALDAADNASPTLTLTVLLGDDADAPTWGDDAAVVASDVFEDRATIQWNRKADDPGGVEAYRIYAGVGEGAGSLVAEVDASTTSAQLAGLLPSTPYTVTVEAVDYSGNVSGDGPSASFTTAIDFADTSGTVFEEDIEWLSGADVTRGCNPPDNDLFCPDDPVTRGQMAAFLVRALKLPSSGHDSFSDDAGSVFQADIDALAASGITRGCNPPDNDLFCPDDPVTRGQMASFLSRGLDLPVAEALGSFGDVAGSVHVADIERLAAAGITRGCNPPTNDLFCPDDPVTRGQMAAFLRRALGG
jgi:subtilisin family serine protease